jgi:hypothetical protein
MGVDTVDEPFVCDFVASKSAGQYSLQSKLRRIARQIIGAAAMALVEQQARLSQSYLRKPL